jgi:DNA mismatch endonuclease (patch repair protein)
MSIKANTTSFPGVSPETSLLMSKIRAKNTRPELIVRQYLFKEGFRYRIHQKNLPGHPDIVLKKYNTAVLIHGCFWHQHPGCKLCRTPKTRQDYWIPKIERNLLRDEQNLIALKNLGWNVIIVWECELHKNKIAETLKNLVAQIRENAAEAGRR